MSRRFRAIAAAAAIAIVLAPALAAGRPPRERTVPDKLLDKTEEIDRQRVDRQRSVVDLRRLLKDDGYRYLNLHGPDIVARLYLLALARPDLFQTALIHHAANMDRVFYECVAEVRADLGATIAILEAQVDHSARAAGDPLSLPLLRGDLAQYRHSLLFVASLEQVRDNPRGWPATEYGGIRFRRSALEERLREALAHAAERLPNDVSVSVDTILINSWPKWSHTLVCAHD